MNRYLSITALFLIGLLAAGCGIYKLKDVSIPPEVKTVKVKYIDNRARYINPQLSPKLTDKLRQKIVGQTRLRQTNEDNADWEITGTITDYSFSTAAISGRNVTGNRLTVNVHVTLNDLKKDDAKDFDISRSFDFSSSLSPQQAETSLLEEIIRTLSDEIFNKLFSNW